MAAPTLTSYRCLSSVYACRLRVSRLHEDGSLQPGTKNLYISDALIDIGVTPDIEAGQELTQRNGCGDICVEAVGDDIIKKYTLALNLCTLDSELIEILSGGRVIQKGGITIGYAAPKLGDTKPNVCIEAWSKAWTNNQQASNASKMLYWRHVWPQVSWTHGQETYGNAVAVIPLAGKATQNDMMGLGPAADFPGLITEAYARFEDDAMPDAVCGYQNLTIAGSAS